MSESAGFGDIGALLPDVFGVGRADTTELSARGENTADRYGLRPIDPAVITAGLNDQQLAAVTFSGGSLLVMAGAGSGKTRVLTRRIAYLLATGRARPGEIMAITFTNKAAAEMRERVLHLVGERAKYMAVSTFHSACVRILRENASAAGVKSGFSIYDAADSKRLIAMIARDLNIDTKRAPEKTVAARISDAKNELLSAADYAQRVGKDPLSRAVTQIYPEYQRRLAASNALDFDDLIMRTVQLLAGNAQVAEHYRRRYRHILVDEYQDTNHAQYVLVRLLVGGGKGDGAGASNDDLPPAELTVVGDSDQSIYGFRGATIRNIQEFEQDFPGAETIYLEQNYRSTQTILSAANSVISAGGGAANDGASGAGAHRKKLWTDAGDGAPITVHAADSDRDEAAYVVSEIDRLALAGRKYSDFAVFYRTNAQSRVLEERLMRAGVPYRVVGGTKFYERREIKDALAYLRVLANPADTVSLRRIINTPRRAIGDKAQASLAAWAQTRELSFGAAVAAIWHGWADRDTHLEPYAALPDGVADLGPVADLGARAMNAIAKFWQDIASLRRDIAEGATVVSTIDETLDRCGYLDALQGSEDPQDGVRVENLAEFHAVAAEFSAQHTEATLIDFLESVSLVADADQIGGDEAGEVTLMTVHTAKGLEFPVVFVTGMEDGTFPHQRSLGDASELAEERRLAYVAITRAREILYFTRSAVRLQWGSPQALPSSRFLADIPEELCDLSGAQADSERVRGSLFDDGSGYGGYSAGGYSGRGYGHGRRYRGRDYGFGDDVYGDEWSDGSRDNETYTSAYGSGYTGHAGYSGGSGASDGYARGSGASGRVHTRRMAPKSSRSGSSGKTNRVTSLAVGDRVNHDSYGLGTVIAVSGSGASMSAEVDFGDGSIKRLLLRYSPMEKL